MRIISKGLAVPAPRLSPVCVRDEVVRVVARAYLAGMRECARRPCSSCDTPDFFYRGADRDEAN